MVRYAMTNIRFFSVSLSLSTYCVLVSRKRFQDWNITFFYTYQPNFRWFHVVFVQESCKLGALLWMNKINRYSISMACCGPNGQSNQQLWTIKICDWAGNPGHVYKNIGISSSASLIWTLREIHAIMYFDSKEKKYQKSMNKKKWWIHLCKLLNLNERAEYRSMDAWSIESAWKKTIKDGKKSKIQSVSLNSAYHLSDWTDRIYIC